jgi:hypothetical protein
MSFGIGGNIVVIVNSEILDTKLLLEAIIVSCGVTRQNGHVDAASPCFFDVTLVLSAQLGPLPIVAWS